MLWHVNQFHNFHPEFWNVLPSKEFSLCKDWKLILQIQLLMFCPEFFMEFLEIIVSLPDYYFCYSLRWSFRKYLQHNTCGTFLVAHTYQMFGFTTWNMHLHRTLKSFNHYMKITVLTHQRLSIKNTPANMYELKNSYKLTPTKYLELPLKKHELIAH